jgi:hypothetical protein
MQRKIIGDHQCGFRHNRSTNDHAYIVHSSNTWEKIGIQRSISSPGSDHLSESEPQFHCPTLESVRVSTVTGSILTCYKCLPTRKVITPSAQWFQETRVTTGCAKMCVSSRRLMLPPWEWQIFVCFCFVHACPMFSHPHTIACSQLMDIRETGMIIMALGATVRL